MRYLATAVLLHSVASLASAVPVTYDFVVSNAHATNLATGTLTVSGTTFKGWVTFDTAQASVVSKDKRIYNSATGCAVEYAGQCYSGMESGTPFITQFHIDSPIGAYALPSSASLDYTLRNLAYVHHHAAGVGGELSRTDPATGASRFSSFHIALKGEFEDIVFGHNLETYATGRFDFYDYASTPAAGSSAGGFLGTRPFSLSGDITHFALREANTVPEPGGVALFAIGALAALARWRRWG